MIDLTKLTSLPLEIVRGMESAGNDGTEIRTLPKRRGEYGEVVAFMHGRRADAEAFLLGRLALDVMMRRPTWHTRLIKPWGHPYRHHLQKFVVYDQLGAIVGPLGSELIYADDPFTALVEADKWATEHGL